MKKNNLSKKVNQQDKKFEEMINYVKPFLKEKSSSSNNKDFNLDDFLDKGKRL